MKRVLVAHAQLTMIDEIVQLIEDMALPGNPRGAFARNREQALGEAADDAIAAVVIDIDLPSHARTGPLAGGGLLLAQALAAQRPGLALVLVAPCTDPALAREVQAIEGAALVLEGSAFDADLERALRQGLAGRGADAVLASATAVSSPVRYVIEIHLHTNGNCLCQMRSVGARVPERVQIPFEVRSDALQQLIVDTQALAGSAHWARDYQAIGERLRVLLLEGNVSIMRNLGRLEGLASGHPDAQLALSFVVDRAIYPIALEALRDGSDDDRHYWLERGPLWRQLNLRSGQVPLFQDDETRSRPINCLVVEADSSGIVGRWGMEFAALPNLKAEVACFIDELQHQTTVRVGRVARIWQEAGRVQVRIADDGVEMPAQTFDGPFAEVLRDLLTTGEPWHLVHFAGHTHYDADNDWGYVLMPGELRPGVPAAPDHVGAPEFAQWLARTRLVCMSSCRGASQDFVFNLCQHAVPAVTGFRWDIEDDIANQHARKFYRELFRCRSIEQALQLTWKHMYGRERGNRVWASSQLVMQVAA